MTIDFDGALYHVGDDGTVTVERGGEPLRQVEESSLPLPVARVVQRSRVDAARGLPRRRRRRFVPPDRSPYPWAQPVHPRE